MAKHSQAYRTRRKAALHQLVSDIHNRTIPQQVPLNSDQRNALAHKFPNHWDKEGNRLMKAGGIVDCTGSEAEILTRHQPTSYRTPLARERSMRPLVRKMSSLPQRKMKTFTSLKDGRDGVKKLLSLLDQSSESLRDQISNPNYSDYSISVLILLQKWVALCWY